MLESKKRPTKQSSHQTRPHHPFSPSRLYRLHLCPGSFAAEESARATGYDPPSADEALEGTRRHIVVERSIQTLLIPDNGIESIEDIQFDSDDDEQFAVRALRWLERKLQDVFCSDCSFSNLDALRSRLRFDLEPHVEIHEPPADGLPPEEKPEPLTAGYADLVVTPVIDVDRNGSVETVPILLVDWKFYRAPVVPEAIAVQLGAYAMGVLAVAPDEIRSKARVIACAYNPISSDVWSTEFTASDRDTILAWIRRTIDSAQCPDAELRPHIDACKTCRALAVCPATVTVMDEFESAVPVEQAKRSQNGSSPAKPSSAKIDDATIDEAIKALPPGKVLSLVARAKLVQKIADRLLVYAKDLLLSGVESDEWQITERRGRRMFTDPAEAFRLLMADGAPPGDVTRLIKISVTDAERLFIETLRNRVPSIKVAQAKRKFAERYDTVIARGQTIQMIAPKHRKSAQSKKDK